MTHRPLPELQADELVRYARHFVLPEVGAEGQRRLKGARVLIVGAGGLGSPVALYLAAAGIGTLGLVDFDTVDTSNLQRQILHGTRDVGRPKTVSARDRLRDVNPHVDVHLHETRLTSHNALELVAGYDVVVDGSDNFPTRYLVNDACVLTRRPNVYGSVFRFEGQASVFATLGGPCYRCLHPEPPPAGLVPSCAEGGVLGVLCASIASIMSTEAIKLLTGIGESLLGRLMIYDALAMTYRTITVRKDPAAPAITGLIDYEAYCGVPAQADPGITARELRALLDDGGIALIDVREPGEWEINRIDGAVLIPKSAIESGEALLPAGRIPVLYCKTGVRSAQALAVLKRAGYADALHLRGGIVAWAAEFEPDMVMY